MSLFNVDFIYIYIFFFRSCITNVNSEIIFGNMVNGPVVFVGIRFHGKINKEREKERERLMNSRCKCVFNENLTCPIERTNLVVRDIATNDSLCGVRALRSNKFNDLLPLSYSLALFLYP